MAQTEPVAKAGEKAVLFVDDDSGTLALELAVLAPYPSVRTLSARGAQEALTLLLTERLDVAVVDLHLPGFSGIELSRRFRVAAPGAQTRIILTSADGTGAAQAAKEPGIHAFLQKSFTAARLWTTVRDAIPGGLEDYTAA